MADKLLEEIILDIRGKMAIIILNIPEKLNALGPEHYYRLSTLMRQVAARDDIYITILTARGRFFSALSGADVTNSPESPPHTESRQYFLRTFVANNLDITHAFYTHPKILVTALNGPVVGLSAALIALSDFIYCTPETFILTPFSSLGLVAEGGASRAFVQRLGIAKANEALIMSKKITADELLATGFVNKVFDTGRNEQEKFFDKVMIEVEERLGGHLNSDSLLNIKSLIRKPEREVMDVQTVAEVFGGLEKFATGLPQEEFRKIRSGEKRHKL